MHFSANYDFIYSPEFNSQMDETILHDDKVSIVSKLPVDRFFRDNGLCFGLRCAPFIFTQLMEFVLRCMMRHDINGIFRYLDDFLLVAEDELSCKLKLDMLIELLISGRLGFGLLGRRSLQ